MRVSREQAEANREKILEVAGTLFRERGFDGTAVDDIMRRAGLTHGGFYKHFESKDELLMESLSEAFREMADCLTQAAEHSQQGTAWKAIVKAYLSPEHCDHVDCGCPLAALAPELARADKPMKAEIFGELTKYRNRMLPFMPGRRVADKERAFMVIFSTMLGALGIARILLEPAARARILASARDFLLNSF